ncbi:SpvB/TcaC N-terminal domain-containing protein [Dokdonella immobilis]|uniref:RHS repeat-associated core domain-containing protein n=1 Tax=Dokdonella immobilis TaxID=578942 RepID=A0A1I4VIP6_9GAMM|nr:SpvB/TcaC N-terminal domain-containing protein [Dokdonella immobilis]SFN01061.1 RHS repeat-associated core domain-containing protein [Dokdonella immobilis]
MERERQGRHAPFAFVCAMLMTLGAGVSSLYPQREALASGVTTLPPNVTLDAAPNHDASTGTMADQAGTDGGASTYRVPIVVPPGRAGMQPSLALVYNSRSGDGVAGLGWSISGLSSIHRCPQTPEQDGQTRGVSYTLNDRLCLDGQRLVKVGGSYGQLNATYKTEIDSYARITQLGGNIDGASAYFKVEQKDGRILYYGTTTNSRVAPSGTNNKPLSWLVDKIEDRIGNFQSYSYDVSNGYGEVLLDTVTYTGLNGVAGNRTVTFHYKTRTDAASGAKDVASSALAGGMSMQTQALDWIRTAVGGVTVLRYEPNYAVSKYSGRLLLTSMKECAGETATCHPPSRFVYNDEWLDPASASEPTFQLKSLSALGLPSPPTPTPGLDGQAHSDVYRVRVGGDYDGDGTRETVVSITNGVAGSAYLAQFTADRRVHNPLLIPSDYNLLQALDADIDGSGRSTLVGTMQTGLNVAFGMWDIERFPRGLPPGQNPFVAIQSDIALSSAFPIGHIHNVYPGDFDGDGHTDILVVRPEPACGSIGPGTINGLSFYKNQITGALSSTDTAHFGGRNFLTCLPRIVSGGVYVEAVVDHIGDFNGDGLADVFLTYAGGGEEKGDFAGIAITQLGANSANIGSCAQIGLASDDCTWGNGYVSRWMDVNADGLEDLVLAKPVAVQGKWHIRLNNGNGQLGVDIDTGSSAGLQTYTTGGLVPVNFRYADRLPSMDVDSDGRADILIPSQKPGKAAFALRMCTLKKVRQIGTEGCPTPGSAPPSSGGEDPEVGEVCAAYACPPYPESLETDSGDPDDDPDFLDDMPQNPRQPGYRWSWFDPQGQPVPAFNSYSSSSIHGGTFDDNSVYHLAQVKFVQTGPASFTASVTETPLVSRLSDYYGGNDDLFGDGLQDLTTSVGCLDIQVFHGDPNSPVWIHQLCSPVDDPDFGPATIPDGTPVSALAAQLVLYANVNQGIPAPGGSPDATTIPGSPRPSAPTLNATGGINLSLPIPHLPGLMDRAVGGVGDFAVWGYYPLSVPAKDRYNKIFYTVLPDQSQDPNGYADERHYYFQSSMPTVYGMAQNNGLGSASGYRSATYTYREAMYHHLGRGFQGFRSISSTIDDPSDRALRTTTTFHQKFPLTGRIEEVDTEVPSSGRLLKHETDTWICDLARGSCPQGGDIPGLPSSTNGGVVFAPLLDKQLVENFDLVSGARYNYSETVNAEGDSSSGWDLYGNLKNQVITSVEEGANAVFSQHGVVNENVYANDLGSWWLGQLSSSTVTTSLSYSSNHPLPNGVNLPPARKIRTEYSWNPDRTPLSTKVHDELESTWVETTYDYSETNAKGLPNAVTIDASNLEASRRTTFDYTKDGTTSAGAGMAAMDGYFVLNTKNPAGHSTRTTHELGYGQVLDTVDPNQLTTSNEYDGFGRLKSMSFMDANNNVMLPPVNIGYFPCSGGYDSSCGNGFGDSNTDNQHYAAWRVVRVQSGHPTAVDWFDPLGRTIKHVERGFSDADFVETFTEYEAMGTVYQQSAPFYRLDGNGSLTAWTYDPLGRPLTKRVYVGDLGASSGDVLTTYAYEGNKTSINVRVVGFTGSCNNLNNQCMNMSRTYDMLGRLAQTVQGNGTNPTYSAADYWYDGTGNPIAARDAGGSVIKGMYNDFGQRTDLYDPDAGHRHFIYDGLGELVTQTDARGVSTTQRYDSLGRVFERTATDSSAASPVPKVIFDEWSYDPKGFSGGKGLLAYSQRRTGASLATLGSSPIWKESYLYETNTKRPSTVTTEFEGQNPLLTGYAYDAAGHVDRVDYPSGLTVERAYTGYGLLNRLSNFIDGTEYWRGESQDAWGNTTRETYLDSINGVHSSYPSTGQAALKTWTQDSALLNQLDYKYDSFGNLKFQGAVLSGVAASESYVYDGLQRLTQTTRIGVPGNPAPINYKYKPNGNLEAKSDFSSFSDNAYTYDAGTCGPHAVTGVANSGITRTYTCDANGNVIGGSEITFANYDFNNQPWKVSRSGAGTALFAYTPNGDLFRTIAGDQSTWIGPEGYETSVVAGVTVYRHELGPVLVLRENGADTAKAVLRDRLGSQVMLVSRSGGGGGGPPALPAPTSNANPSLDGHYTISWQTVTGATRYELFEQVGDGKEMLVYAGADTHWSPAAPRPVGTYNYRWHACDVACGEFSGILIQKVAPLPASITLSPNPSTGTYSVSWTHPDGAQTFRLEEQVVTGARTSPWVVLLDQSSATHWDALGKAAGKYNYRVLACSDVCGGFSTVVTETVNSAVNVPQPPAWLTATFEAGSTTSYRVNWASSASASYYLLEEKIGLGNFTPVNGVTGTFHLFSNRPPGTYTYRARACNSIGCSVGYSPTATITVDALAVCNPQNLVIAPDNSLDGNFRLTWDPVPGTGIRYSVEESTTASTPYQWHVVSDQTATLFDVTGKPDGSYPYRVRAYSTTCSGYSAVYIETVRLVPDVPTMHPPSPTSSNGQFELSWSPSPTATYYRLSEQVNGVWSEIGDDNGQGIHGTSVVLHRGDGDYHYKVRGCFIGSQVRCSGESNVVAEHVSGSGLPIMPPTITSSLGDNCGHVSAGHPASYTISWSLTNGTEYEVLESNADVPGPSTYFTTADHMAFTHGLPGSPPGGTRPDSTTYDYFVRACIGTGSNRPCSIWKGGAHACVGDGLNRPGAENSATAYDAFGKVRNGDYSDKANGTLNLLPDTVRGFTGHQHVDDVRLIHMNGRVYDYQLGRFLSVDPVIQFPTNTQSMNPYSYIMNNPLSGRDPTGYQSCSTGTHIEGSSGPDCDSIGVAQIQVGQRSEGPKQKSSGSQSQSVKVAPVSAADATSATKQPALDNPGAPTKPQDHGNQDGMLGAVVVTATAAVRFGEMVSPFPWGFSGTSGRIPWAGRGGLAGIATALILYSPNAGDPNECMCGCGNTCGALTGAAGLEGLRGSTMSNEAGENADSGETAPPVPGAKPGRETRGRTTQWEAPGGMTEADRDFDGKQPTGVRTLPNGGRVGKLPDGSTIVVRPNSSDGRPTLEIQHGKTSDKVRYGNK